MRRFIVWLCSMVASTAFAQALPPWRASTPEEQRLDAVAFENIDKDIEQKLGDVQSLVVVLEGRTVHEYYRDGDPNALRDTQSVTKSALALLVGTALRRGQLSSLELSVVELMPEWRALNSDPRAQTITLRHLMAMTAGFAVDDRSGTAAPLTPASAWARSIQSEPGQRFAYDNNGPPMVQAVLERVTGRPMADLARDQLVTPLEMREPTYSRGGLASMRTVDMAKLGHLVLLDGTWAGTPLLPPGFVAQMVKPQSSGGPPVNLPYGLFWWVPSGSTFFASGYSGQLIWVHSPLRLVVAVTSTISPDSAHRGQALTLARGPVFQAVQRRLALSPK
ncbi:CubicO group peptidase (beta-lactamase class C family) [Variovorax sp. SG517]|uniref:serine hydrolase domain-containing protein n=1 Tax=Variovorax sp. SG517 TaxID=2587117 RepID=UPI00159D52C0|nr:serine hydrolase [Variovorax sp. SG517]NVM93131.1 CubicO group peptidase (beta-lactamase class C family) [Variovorax sp. SG517]